LYVQDHGSLRDEILETIRKRLPRYRDGLMDVMELDDHTVILIEKSEKAKIDHRLPYSGRIFQYALLLQSMFIKKLVRGAYRIPVFTVAIADIDMAWIKAIGTYYLIPAFNEDYLLVFFGDHKYIDIYIDYFPTTLVHTPIPINHPKLKLYGKEKRLAGRTLYKYHVVKNNITTKKIQI